MALDDKYHFAVMPPDAYVGAGSCMINIRQEWPSMASGDRFMRVMIHERDAEALCEQIMAAAKEARKA
jgi:hypothetical protein